LRKRWGGGDADVKQEETLKTTANNTANDDDVNNDTGAEEND